MWVLLRQWLRRVCCEHPNRMLVGITREVNTYTRQGAYHCPDCDREWISWQLPDSVAR